VAVFLVIFYHFGMPIPGGQGVIIFFVLSGFLITWLLLKEDEKYGRVSLTGFYWRRALRILPAFYFYWISVVALLLIAGKNLNWPHAISSLFFYANYYHAVQGDPNNAFSHTWSLAIEEQFYLLWPMLFLMFRRNLKRLTIVLASVIGLVWIHRFILYFVMHTEQAYFYSAFDTRMDGLFAGCLVAVLLKRGSMMGFWRVLCSNAAMPLMIFALLLTSVVMGEMISGYRDLIGLGLHPILMAVMLVQMLSMPAVPWFRWLDSRLMIFLGQISYSLFLYQQLVIHPVSQRMAGWPSGIQLIGAILVTVFIAVFSYYLVEKPFLNLKARSSAAVKAKTRPPAVVQANEVKPAIPAREQPV
jgi:peptidoglycan/LPS O-acetylase OafA/YrhL